MTDHEDKNKGVSGKVGLPETNAKTPMPKVKAPRKSNAGRPQIEIDWELVDSLLTIQCVGEEIAGVIGCSYDTVERACRREHGMNFADYSEQKRVGGRTSLRRAQWQAATIDRNPTMMVWLGKQVLGQSDKREVDLGNSDGSLRPRPLDLTKLPPAALEAIVAAADEQSSDD